MNEISFFYNFNSKNVFLNKLYRRKNYDLLGKSELVYLSKCLIAAMEKASKTLSPSPKHRNLAKYEVKHKIHRSQKN